MPHGGELLAQRGRNGGTKDTLKHAQPERVRVYGVMALCEQALDAGKIVEDLVTRREAKQRPSTAAKQEAGPGSQRETGQEEKRASQTDSKYEARPLDLSSAELMPISSGTQAGNSCEPAVGCRRR